ncbi:MAG: DUF1634 domain-containing protein [Thermoleophilia bacterium]|nr:DUF1634 domain-containing protein [Thermoleophilia bacterium]
MSVESTDTRAMRPANDRLIHGRRLETVLSGLLLLGLAVAVILMVTGAVLAAVRPGVSVARETSITDMPRALAALEPAGFFDLGILVLLASPVARVVALLAAFARHRRWFFCGLSLLVVAILALSAFLGIRTL